MRKIFLSIIGLSVGLFAYNYGTYEGNIKGCEEGNAKACNDLAGMYLTGRIQPDRVKEDEEKAKLYYAKSKELYTKYCDEGDGKACYGLAQIYNGMKWNVDQNHIMMLKNYIKSCDNGYGKGCVESGAFYKRGYGAKKDMDTANVYYAKAVSLLEEECDRDIAPSCKSLSMIYKLNMYGTNDAKKGEALAKKTFALNVALCEKKDVEGCFQMAFYNENGIQTPLNLKKAKEYYLKSCEYGESSACSRGRDLDVSKQSEREKNWKLQKLMSKYGEKEIEIKKARDERVNSQMKIITDTNRPMEEREKLLKKAEAEEAQYQQKIQIIREEYKAEVEKIKSQTN